MFLEIILLTIILFQFFAIFLLFKKRKIKIKQENLGNLKQTVEQKFAEMVSYNTHFSNIISGINHEVSPWIGGIANITPMIKRLLLSDNIDRKELEYLLDRINMACKQGSDVLGTLSQNVKRLKEYSVFNSVLGDTVLSWCQMNLIDKNLKSLIDGSNVEVNISTLTFKAKHSPMLLSQIIYNIVKNSVDHNQHMLDTLKIKLYGNEKDTLYIEDSGKGMDKQVLSNVFKLGFTTKDKDKTPHGIGLATCLDYCLLMDAKIKVESEPGKYTRFIIKFKNVIDDESKDFYEIKDEYQYTEDYTKMYKRTTSEREIIKDCWERASSSQVIKKAKNNV